MFSAEHCSSRASEWREMVRVQYLKLYLLLYILWPVFPAGKTVKWKNMVHRDVVKVFLLQGGTVLGQC